MPLETVFGGGIQYIAAWQTMDACPVLLVAWTGWSKCTEPVLKAHPPVISACMQSQCGWQSGHGWMSGRWLHSRCSVQSGRVSEGSAKNWIGPDAGNHVAAIGVPSFLDKANTEYPAGSSYAQLQAKTVASCVVVLQANDKLSKKNYYTNNWRMNQKPYLDL